MKNILPLASILAALNLLLATPNTLVAAPQPPRPLELRDGQLRYAPDSLGNRIPDFSHAGYKGGDADIPNAPVKLRLQPTEGDATALIQQAIDYVGTLPADNNGLRGAVLLEAGTYHVEGALRLASSGVVLRGSGVNSTTIVGAGTDRQTLITVAGKGLRTVGAWVKVADAYVPSGATQLNLATQSFKVGDRVLVQRPGLGAWIQALGMAEFGGGISALGWKPGSYDISWDRTIVAVSGSTITLDAPITTALDSAYGGGLVASYSWPQRVANVGVENLRLQSSYNRANAKDEAHRWMAIVVENAQDVWVRQLNFLHFAGSAVAVWQTAGRVTVEDCKSTQPVSEVGGERRYTFYTEGTQTLFQRCFAEDGYHDFAAGHCAAGPNAFVQCEARMPHSFSGAIGSWTSGLLLDVVNIDGHALGFFNRWQDSNGAGFTAANSVLWQCTAAQIYNLAPPTAQNYAFGCWSQFIGNGYWVESNNHVSPRSLYYAQLAQRLGRSVAHRAQLIDISTSATSSPSVEQAEQLVAAARLPVQTLPNWVDQAAQRNPIPTGGGKLFAPAVSGAKIAPRSEAKPLEVVNGKITRGGMLVVGNRIGIPYWSGSIKPAFVRTARPHLTRYVPGRTGIGFTDDLDSLASYMQAQNIVGIEHHYGLWYERRRDDHERIRRMDGEVWPPFYEQPFARSGQGTAWDGLSKYDLTTFNIWYWQRLKTFANIADRHGLMLVQQHYFQHNIIEAGAHWADSPWRTANNINSTAFPEPPPYAGDKRIFQAEPFYDTEHPARRSLHVAYIRKCLDSFADNGSVLHLTSDEFTGPLHFVQFWLDVIADWQTETGHDALVGLSATKDVQDSILADPRRASLVDVIDMRYWWYQANGEAYAPLGGLSLAPRQHARNLKPKPSSFAQVYRAVREYRQRFPSKAVIVSELGSEYAWAEFFAGGSLPPIPVRDADFLASSAAMQPADGDDAHYLLASPNAAAYMVYVSDTTATLDLTRAAGDYAITWFDARSGRALSPTRPQTLHGGAVQTLHNPQAGGAVAWVRK
ncbi:MAG: DUF6298 domain-containing protein [Prevotellaceae bacterium]|jgi:hypothetical protein|nr:DUF6298 domain-containing protein [Prevotellaceae bacterium]